MFYEAKQMFGNPSLLTRIAVGKGIGLIIGLIGVVSMSYFTPDTDWFFRLGILLWYPTVGAIVGVFGVYTWHPVLKLPMPWWFRSTIIGAWLNFVLVFIAYNELEVAAALMFGADSLFASPFWFTLEGAFVGLIIGFCATRLGGEGIEAVAADAKTGMS